MARRDIAKVVKEVRDAEIEAVITGIEPQPDRSSPEGVYGEVSGQIGGEEGRERDTGRSRTVVKRPRERAEQSSIKNRIRLIGKQREPPRGFS